MERKRIPERTQRDLGVPCGAEGWYFALANAVSESRHGEEKDSFLVVAWDKPPKQQQPPQKSTTKAYGVFKDHATFWENLNAVPVDQRYAYEVMPTLRPCRGYWDIEFCIDLPDDPAIVTASHHQLQEATRDTHLLMTRWIAKLKEVIFSQIGIQAKVAVLDGTRIVNSTSPPLGFKVKFSYHVILVNVSFVHNQSKAFNQIKAALPTLYTLAMELTDPVLNWKPPQNTPGAPDMCVYGNNQLFRCLSCAKRGASTPLTFASADLTDTTDPFDTFVSVLGGVGQCNQSGDVVFVPEPPKTAKHSLPNLDSEARKKRKRPSKPPIAMILQSQNFMQLTTPAQPPNKKSKTASLKCCDGGVNDNSQNYDSEEEEADVDVCRQTLVETMLSQFPLQMKNIQDELQELLRSWGDLNTKVEKLVRVTSNLRYQCRNVDNRSCILSSEAHQSNNPILWLDSSRCTNEGELAEHYQVMYNCKSSECQGQGIIGEIELNKESGLYRHRLITPPLISKDPKGLVLKAKLNRESLLSREVQPPPPPPPPPHIPEKESRVGESMQTFVEMLHGGVNDGGAVGGRQQIDSEEDYHDQFEGIAGACPPLQQQQQQTQVVKQRNLLEEKLAGFGWSQYELQIFGREKTYDAVKRLQEKTMCKILTPNVMYIRFRVTKGVQSLLYDHYTYENMQKYLKPLFYLKKVEAESTPELARFFNAWTDDPTSRTYNAIVCDPSKDSVDTGPEDLNVWPGFVASLIAEISDLDAVKDLVQPIVLHIRDVIVNGVEDHAEWLLDWMANIVQRPEQKTQVPVVISGKQGVGKGIIFDFFREFVLGFAVTTQVQNASQDLFSRFANKHVNKVLLQMDEGDGLSKYADHLKNLTTASHVNYEIKGLSPMIAKNYLNIIITTNHERPVLVETSDRRFVLFKASDIHLGKPLYYSTLGGHLKRPQVARAFYQFLMARDLAKYVDHFQTSRPVTDYYLQARKNSISNLHKFISALINSKKYVRQEEDTSAPDYVAPTAIIVNVHPKIVFQEFIRFLESGRYQSTMTATGFASKMKVIDGVNRASRRDGTPFYSLNYTVMRHALQKSHEYDDEITLD